MLDHVNFLDEIIRLIRLYYLDISIGLDKQNFECKIVNVFLPFSLNICFGCSKEPSH